MCEECPAGAAIRASCRRDTGAEADAPRISRRALIDELTGGRR